VGERIAVSLRRKKRIPLSWISVAAACVFFFLGLTFWLQMPPKYEHVVAIDINPSLELYLDSEERVIKAKPLNPDAEKVLSSFPSGKLTLHDAIEQVLTKSIALGYINKDKENIIMISSARLGGSSELNVSSLESVVTKTLQSEHINGFVKVQQTDKSIYEASKEKHLSLNKWLLIQDVEQQGIHVDLNKAASESVLQVLQEAGINKEQFFEPIQISANQDKDDQKKVQSFSGQTNSAEDVNQSTNNISYR
jgi:hypothetical protein